LFAISVFSLHKAFVAHAVSAATQRSTAPMYLATRHQQMMPVASTPPNDNFVFC